MKKKNEFDEFIRQLEEAVDNIIDEIDNPEDKPVNINISINLYPVMIPCPGNTDVRHARKTPVDILETDKKIHAILRIPDMEMKTIKLTGPGKVLEITALSGNEAVMEEIELPARVNKSGMKTTYKNGILEVVLNKRRQVKKNFK